MEQDKGIRVQQFLKKIIEKLTPAVVEAVENDSSGHCEVHFDRGQFTRAKKNVTL